MADWAEKVNAKIDEKNGLRSRKWQLGKRGILIIVDRSFRSSQK